MYYSLSWYDVNHKLQENYCVDVILSLETADDVNSKSFPLDSADIHMKAMLQSGKTKNAANTTSIYESKTRIVNIFYNPYREQPSQSEVKKSQGWLVSASRAAHFYELDESNKGAIWYSCLNCADKETSVLCSGCHKWSYITTTILSKIYTSSKTSCVTLLHTLTDVDRGISKGESLS